MTFTLFGKVELVFAMHPRHAKIKGATGTTHKSVINIVPEKKYDFKILSVKAEKGTHIRYELKDIKIDDQTRYQLMIENTVTTKGRFFDTIVLKTDSEFQPEISVWVFVDLKGEDKKNN